MSFIPYDGPKDQKKCNSVDTVAINPIPWPPQYVKDAAEAERAAEEALLDARNALVQARILAVEEHFAEILGVRGVLLASPTFVGWDEYGLRLSTKGLWDAHLHIGFRPKKNKPYVIYDLCNYTCGGSPVSGDDFVAVLRRVAENQVKSPHNRSAQRLLDLVTQKEST